MKTKRAGAILLVALSMMLTVFSSLTLAKQDKVTICHAAGQVGTKQYVTLTLPWVAVYGQAGHLNENGTTQAGHEDDYLGACLSASSGSPEPTPTMSQSIPTPTPSPVESSTPEPSPETPAASQTLTPDTTPDIVPDGLPDTSMLGS